MEDVAFCTAWRGLRRCWHKGSCWGCQYPQTGSRPHLDTLPGLRRRNKEENRGTRASSPGLLPSPVLRVAPPPKPSSMATRRLLTGPLRTRMPMETPESDISCRGKAQAGQIPVGTGTYKLLAQDIMECIDRTGCQSLVISTIGTRYVGEVWLQAAEAQACTKSSKQSCACRATCKTGEHRKFG